ncbi:MAG TPA: M23 family metallopeptidase [Vicinamibacterales bacterium]|nr:M23 family metallopeptidase [Vicinamibacterales bacterium]
MRLTRYTILVANRESGVVRRFTLPLKPLVLGALALMAVPVLVGLGARWSAGAELAALRHANEEVRVENESYRLATGELAGQIAALQTAVDQLGNDANLDPATRRAIQNLPKNVRERAMGGGSAAAPENTIGVLRGVLNVIDAQVSSVRSAVERQQLLANATPSIWPTTGWLTSSFGGRVDPFTGGRDYHAGLDISADKGKPVRATADGTISESGWSGNYGNMVLVGHRFGLSTRYGHLSRLAVARGQFVRRGEVIGYVGSTGRSTSPHLHYEVLLNGQAINPLRFLTR